MGFNSNKKRAEQLGMSYGAANGRLKKNIMFKFAQELGYDTCYACSNKIETSEELSVEHIEPWEDRENGVEKFWDLNNIAFSHLTCNIKHSSNSRFSYIAENCPEGQAWCYGHKDYLSIENFYNNKSRNNGLCNLCKHCMFERDKNRKR